MTKITNANGCVYNVQITNTIENVKLLRKIPTENLHWFGDYRKCWKVEDEVSGLIIKSTCPLTLLYSPFKLRRLIGILQHKNKVFGVLISVQSHLVGVLDFRFDCQLTNDSGIRDSLCSLSAFFRLFFEYSVLVSSVWDVVH